MIGQMITLDGPEGTGKSTNLAYIKELLQQSGHQLVLTREPGGTEIAEKIREILLDPKYIALTDDAELLLMFAARAQHLQEKVYPAMEQGKTVLCDRFTDATYAYQGAGRNIPAERIAVLEDWVQGAFRPYLTLILDAPIEVGMQRARQRGALDRFEQEQDGFFQRVRQSYLQRAAAEPERYAVIDCAQPLAKVQAQIASILTQRELL